jgi:hypothetical protein
MFINKITYHLQMKLLCILTISLCLSACISRLSRPEISGQVVDGRGQPIAAVQVAETQTDQHGYFQLKEQRYSAFLLKEIMYMEAPPVFFQTTVIKFGYQPCYLHYFNRFGGGQRKGAQWKLGKIILQSNLNAQGQRGIDDCTVKTQEK